MENIAVSGESVPNAFSAILNLFDQTLDNNEKFVFTQIGLVDSTTTTDDVKSFIVHIRDHAQRILLTITRIADRRILGGQQRHHVEVVTVVTQMVNASGEVVLTAKDVQISRVMTIWSGTDGKYLGKLANRSDGLTFTDEMERLLFHTDTDVSFCSCWSSPPSEITVIRNGVTLARIKQSNGASDGAELYLSISESFDLRTKAFLIFAGYFLYLEYFADTTLGRTGLFGVRRRHSCYATAIFFVIVLILTFVLIGSLI